MTIAVLFVDFPDTAAAHTTQAEAMLGLPWADDYLEAASYGALDIEFVPLHRWLRASNPETGNPFDASEEAMALADDEFDYSMIDMVLTVFPSSHFGGGAIAGPANIDGVTVPFATPSTP
ncbi:MAG: hypothetical protein OXS29_16040 [bacterium]|nr:hypothetical protein [bacterium]MDE0288442.1 hypothetical protein [bacterium]MDE0438024.1 hypothetical protein [bacterium]